MGGTVSHLLYVEDDANDRLMLRFACQRAGLPVEIHEVKNGRAALDYLAGSGPYADREQFPFPELAILDLKLPFKSGLDVLHWIRGQPTIKDLPVVILTSSEQEEDKRRAAAWGANHYFIKPMHPDDLVAIVKQIYSSWIAPDLGH